MLDIKTISIIVSILAIVLGVSVPSLGLFGIVNFQNINIIRKTLEENNSISSVEYNRLVEENDHSNNIIIGLIILTLPAIVGLILSGGYNKYHKIAMGLSVTSIILLSVTIGLLAHHKFINSNKFTGGIETILLTGTLTQEQFDILSKEQKGLLIAINILLILVVIGISGVAGYVLYKNNKSGSANTTTVPNVQPVQPVEPSESKYELTNTPF